LFFVSELVLLLVNKGQFEDFMADNELKIKGKSRPRPLNTQMEAFCVFITAIGSATFSKGKASAEAAGYAENSAAIRAHRLLKMPKIQARISEIHAENMAASRLSVYTVLSNLAHDRELAREKQDYSTCVRATELMGKYLAMFTEKSLVELTDMRQLDDSHRDSARVIGAALLSMGIFDSPSTGDELPVAPGALPVTNAGRMVAERVANPVEQPIGRQGTELAAMLDELSPEPEPARKPKPKRSKWVHTAEEVQAELDAESGLRDRENETGETAMVRKALRAQKKYNQQNSCVNK